MARASWIPAFAGKTGMRRIPASLGGAFAGNAAVAREAMQHDGGSMPEMDKETFLVMARQVGFDPDDPHLDELLPDVQLMLGRMDTLFAASTDGLEPGIRQPESES